MYRRRAMVSAGNARNFNSWHASCSVFSAKRMFSTAGSALLSGVTDDVVRRVNDYSAQHIAVTSWAFAKLETSPRPALMQVISLI